MDRQPDAWITRRTLHEGALFGIGHVDYCFGQAGAPLPK